MSLNWLNDPLLLDAEPLPVNKWINANELLQQNRRDEIFQSNGQLNLYPIMVRKNDFIDETLFDILPEVNQKAKDLIGLFSTLTLERFLRYLRFIAVHPESIRESEIIIGDIFSKKKKTLKISGIPSHKVQLIDWRDIPNIHIIWEYLSIITNLQLLPNYMNPAHYIHRQGIFVKETSTDIAKRWLRKINPEIKEIDDEEFREIIDKLTESENLIASSLGIVLSYYSGFTARNLAVLIDDQKWLYNNFPYLLECLDNLPLNKTDFIEKAIETKNLFLISLALSKITNEFTCEEVLTFFKKLLIVLSNYSKEEKKSFSFAAAFGSSSYRLNQVMNQFGKKWLELSNLFINKENNCMRKFQNWIDEILDLNIDLFHFQWWAHFDTKVKIDLMEWSSMKESRTKLLRLFQKDLYTYYYTRNWYRNPSLWEAFLKENS